MESTDPASKQAGLGHRANLKDPAEDHVDDWSWNNLGVPPRVELRNVRNRIGATVGEVDA